MSENRLQADWRTWAWDTYPQFRRLWWHVPNGGKRSEREAAELKAVGVLAGVWDIHCYFDSQLTIIEFKVGNNTLTIDRINKKTGKKEYGQKEWGEMMAAQGVKRFVVYDIEKAQQAFMMAFKINQ